MDAIRKKRPVEPITGGVFLTKKIEAQDDIIEGGLLQRKSIMVVGGISKLGKSVFVLNMGLSLAIKKPFLLQFNVPNSQRVLYVQAEISEKSMQKRLQKMVQAEQISNDILDENLVLINHKGIKLDRARDQKMIGQILEHYGIDVLIIDPMYKFHTGDENKSSDMARFFDGLDALVSDFDCAIVIIHHFGKPSQDNKRYGAMQLRGSSTIFDYADSYISLNRKSGNEPRNYVKATFELRNDEDPNPLYLYRNPDTLWYEVLGDVSQSKVTIHDAITVLNAMGGNGKRQDLIDNIKERTGAGSRIISDVLIKATSLKKIYTKDLPGPGKPKLFYLPGKDE